MVYEDALEESKRVVGELGHHGVVFELELGFVLIVILLIVTVGF